MSMEPQTFAEAHYPLDAPARHFDFVSVAVDDIQPRVSRMAGEHAPRWTLESAEASPGTAMVLKTWRCEDCGLTFQGDQPPG